MRDLLCSIGVVLLIVGCDAGPAESRAAPSAPAPVATRESGPPVMVIDAEHAVREKSMSGKPYLLDAGTAIILNGSQYTFKADDAGYMPNVVQVLYDRSEYIADWPAKGKAIITLDLKTLRTLHGEPFSGFASGKQAFVAVGYRPPGGSAGASVRFSPFWVGSVIFR